MSDVEEDDDMEHDAGASSGGDASSEEDGSSDEDGDAPSSSSEEEIEPRVLPNRTTRGSKMGKLVEEEEEEEGDKEFWQQDFFQEEERDEEWETSESESGDEPDTDFDEPEDEGEDEEEGREPTERRQKRLAPPGAKKKAAAARLAGRKAGASPRGDPTPRPARPSAPAAAPEDAPKLRASTRARVEVAEQERARQEAAQQEMMAKRRSRGVKVAEVKPLTQEELLSEAAKTELENARSLQLLLAREEEVKRRNAVKTTKYVGPTIRYHSKHVGKDTEQTRLELLNMREAPPHLQPRRAPPHPQQPVCQVTGLPAKYRHPETGTPYATLEAYAQIERHLGNLHAAGRPSAKRRYDGDARSGDLAPASLGGKRQRADGNFAEAEYWQQQSSGFAAGHVHAAGNDAAGSLTHNGTF